MPLIDCIIYQNHIYYICTNSILHLDKKNITFLQNNITFLQNELHILQVNITFCKKQKTTYFAEYYIFAKYITFDYNITLAMIVPQTDWLI